MASTQLPVRKIDAAHALIVLNLSGDDTLIWDSVEAAKEIVAEAQRLFDEHRARGGATYTTDRNYENATATKTFDPQAERTVLAHRLIGG
jgi:hypothetical protein